MNEQKAIQLCLKHRDPAGFESLMVQNERRAFFHAHALLGNPEDASDACQDAFIRAFAALPKLEALDHFYPWFNRILRNVCLNMLARRKTRQTHLQDASRSVQDRVQGKTPTDLMEAKESRNEVWQLLNRLSAEHREILTLKYIHSFSYDEIANTLGIPKGTVMSRLYKARHAFRAEHQEGNSSCPEGTDDESR
ncbi:MAG: RNA polymerase sigma factor [Planctomycetota bacterium]|nr:RNA polymerase sigma factor [Planctomycetota bacterium]